MLESSVTISQIRHGLSERNGNLIDHLREDDLVVYRFTGGNVSDTDELIEKLQILKEKQVILLGLFRFPFRFEGKKRLQTAITQYYRMKEICDAIMYFQSDGMLEMIDPNTSIHDANIEFNRMEEETILDLESIISDHGDMNIDFQDIKAFIKGNKSPLYLHTFEGESFDEPLKYLFSIPYLPKDFTDGQQMIINIGYTQDVDMDAFRQINLRLHDLFHKAELFKLGTYFINEPGYRFKITLLINGIDDPFDRPENLKQLNPITLGLFKKWRGLAKKYKWTSFKFKENSTSKKVQ